MKFYVYIIYSLDFDKYYVGQTSNFDERILRHNSGYEKFTAPYKPWIKSLIVVKETRSDAMELERKLKNLSKERIILFIEKYKEEP